MNGFLKKQYISKISKTIRQQEDTSKQLPLFSLIKNKKYFINVYVPFLQQANPWKDKSIMKEMIYIKVEGRSSLKRYSVEMSLGDVFDEMKEYHRLFSDVRSYRKYIEAVRKIKGELYNIPKEVLVDRLKFYVSKLLLMKKNTYSKFYFIPLSNLISEASYKASLIEPEIKESNK